MLILTSCGGGGPSRFGGVGQPSLGPLRPPTIPTVRIAANVTRPPGGVNGSAYLDTVSFWTKEREKEMVIELRIKAIVAMAPIGRLQ